MLSEVISDSLWTTQVREAETNDAIRVLHPFLLEVVR